MIFIIKFLPVALMKSHTPTHITIRNIKITKDYILKISDTAFTVKNRDGLKI